MKQNNAVECFRRQIVAYFVFAATMSEVVGAATFTSDLPNLVGVYTTPSTLSEEIFNLGVEFADVSEASLSITFSASTGVFQSCAGIGCTPVPEDLFPGLFPSLRNPLHLFSPSSTGSSATDLVNVEFQTYWRQSDLDRLLDGSDHVAIELSGLVCIPENTCFFSTQPTATITAASVSVTGTFAGDFDNNGIVDGEDFLLWQRFPSVGPFAAWVANYGMGAPLSASSAAVPEPTTSTLALAALCLAMSRRRAF